MTENRESEELQEEFADEEALLLHFQSYVEARDAMPWSERTRREKVSYYLDRMFIIFLSVAVLVLIGEAVYKTWYVFDMRAVYEFAVSIVTYLLTQVEKEELIEL